MWTTLLTASLLLAACNTDEPSKTANESNEQPDTSEEVQAVTEETEATEAATETEAETPEEQPAEATVEQIVIYGGDANGENIIATSTVDYSYAKNGGITEFLVEQLGLSGYYNKHTVSSDETKIILDFKEDITISEHVQGSSGASIFSDALAVTFFKNIPSLQTLQVRVDGKEQQLDHTAIFTGEITREAVAAEFSEFVK